MTTETKRDLHADLAICNAATGEFWYRSGNGSAPMAVWYSVIGGPDLRNIADDIDKQADATFIAEARTGWPHAIERAINAEEERDQLRELFAKANSCLIASMAEVESLRMQRDSLEATLQHYRGYA